MFPKTVTIKIMQGVHLLKLRLQYPRENYSAEIYLYHTVLHTGIFDVENYNLPYTHFMTHVCQNRTHNIESFIEGRQCTFQCSLEILDS